MIKLVVSDVDGTIVERDEVLHDETVEMARRLRAAGVHYTIATGRVHSQVENYVQQLQLDVPYIACNGGVIVQNGKTLLHNTIPLAPLRPLIHKADEMGMSLLYSVNGHEEAYRLTGYVQDQRDKFGRYLTPHVFTEDEWATLQLDKLIVMAKVRNGSLDIIETMLKQLPPEYGYTRYANKSIDIMHKAGTKEQGIAALCAMLGITMDEVLAVGDDLNDIGMIQQAGVGVAVANALDCVKQSADYVATQPNYLGVLEAAEKYCLHNAPAKGGHTNG